MKLRFLIFLLNFVMSAAVAAAQSSADPIDKERPWGQVLADAEAAKPDCEAQKATACAIIADLYRPPGQADLSEGRPGQSTAEMRDRMQQFLFYAERACRSEDRSSQNAEHCFDLALFYSDHHDAKFYVPQDDFQDAEDFRSYYKLYVDPEFDPNHRSKSDEFRALACARNHRGILAPQDAFALETPNPFCNDRSELEAACQSKAGAACYQVAVVFGILRGLAAYRNGHLEGYGNRIGPGPSEQSILMRLEAACAYDHAEACFHMAALHMSYERYDEVLFAGPDKPEFFKHWAHSSSRDDRIADTYLERACVDLDYQGVGADQYCARFR
ncbi:MAG: hypothetical protein AAF582_16040 [Pseudomonadota bacterium]